MLYPVTEERANTEWHCCACGCSSKECECDAEDCGAELNNGYMEDDMREDDDAPYDCGDVYDIEYDRF